MKFVISLYSMRLPVYLVYMLQQVEYDPRKFLDWFDFLFRQNKSVRSVMYRQQLVPTSKAKLLVVYCYVIYILLLLALGLFFIDYPRLLLLNLISVVIAYPAYILVSLTAVVFIAHTFIVTPVEKKLITASEAIFKNHSATKIAIIGSYGKTTMKELLLTLLSSGKNALATPGNMNVSVSHARFAKKLKGDEEVLIIEFGEGEPGDIERMSRVVHPDYAIVTGLAPNHLDYYPNLQAIADDFETVYDYVDTENVYVNAESELLREHLEKDKNIYSQKSVMDWKLSKITVSVTSTSFIMKKAKETMHITCGLLGRHQVAPVALGCALARQLGVSIKNIEASAQKISPYSHRMQSRNIHGAWLIDDTYNGNIEGLMAGLTLLDELPASRKWYVTPGLVDQGGETEVVHEKLGRAIAKVNPDIVVLMKNSVTEIIKNSMENNGFTGELRIEEKPLEFYTNIEHIIAKGDVVLMQNDWTDNYN